MSYHHQGLIEKLFRSNSKELGLVRSSVGIHEGFLTLLSLTFQAKIFPRAGRNPVFIFSPVTQGRCPVCGSVQHVEFVGKFMVNNIMAPFGMASSTQYRIPDKYDRPRIERLTDNGMRGLEGFLSDFEMTEFPLGRYNRRRINKYGKDIAVKIVRQSKQKQACLGLDGNGNFISQFKTAQTFPVLLSNENLDQGSQMGFLIIDEHAVMSYVSFYDLFPRIRKGCLGQFSAAAISKPLKHDYPLLLYEMPLFGSRVDLSGV
jgi:hypothetical protein